MRIDELAPGLRADQIIGMEVRSSDDKIVGEVRNIVFGTKDRRDYAIVASGGILHAWKGQRIVVPIQSLKVSQERVSFFLPISQGNHDEGPAHARSGLQVAVGQKMARPQRRHLSRQNEPFVVTS